MGFYIRKGVNFGPLRLNLSRSGLGASIGVPGARFGVGPRGSYVHLGRGGFYYRKTLSLPSVPRSARPAPLPQPPTVSNEVEEIPSADAASIVDVSAADLLQELNRVKRRFDIFPVILVVAAIMLITVLLNGLEWWFPLVGAVGAAALAVAGRHYDVTSGTVVLNYSLGPEAQAEFSQLQSAFQALAACQRLWHLDASGDTSDWKRNAGASSLVRRSDAQSFLGTPPKVICNIKVPTIKSKHKSLYFYPDRLLVYDSSGVGAIPYAQVQTSVGHSRYIEDGYVPGDAKQVGTTWRYVNKAGGPDRRFNNNRQYPILQYSVLTIQNKGGLNELFHCSAPEGPVPFSAQIGAFAEKIELAVGGVSFEAPARSSVLAPIALGLATGMMGALAISMTWNLSNQAAAEDAAAKARSARLQFATKLSERVASAARHNNVSFSSADDALLFSFTNEGPKASRRDGVVPFDRRIFFREFFFPRTEADLCELGFRRLEFSANGKPLPQQALECTAPPTPRGAN